MLESALTASVRLSDEQQAELNQHKRAVRISNEKYFRCHPELRSMVKGFMAALIERKPADVAGFAREYFGDTELARRLGYDGWTRPPTPESERAEPPADEVMSAGGGIQAEAARVFRLCDVTADGKLDLDELVNMTGFSKMARNLMGKADVDKSGQLDEEEWVEYIVSLGATKVLPLPLPLPLPARVPVRVPVPLPLTATPNPNRYQGDQDAAAVRERADEAQGPCGEGGGGGEGGRARRGGGDAPGGGAHARGPSARARRTRRRGEGLGLGKGTEQDHHDLRRLGALAPDPNPSPNPSPNPGAEKKGKVIMILFGPPGAGKGSQAPKLLALPLPSPRNQAPKVLTLPVSLPLPLPLSRRPRSSRRSVSRSCPPETCSVLRWPPAVRWACSP